MVLEERASLPNKTYFHATLKIDLNMIVDIRSEDTKLVKKALGNILAGLMQRSQALAVTSVGNISRQNMRLLTMDKGDQGVNKRNMERDRMVEEILELS